MNHAKCVLLFPLRLELSIILLDPLFREAHVFSLRKRDLWMRYFPSLPYQTILGQTLFHIPQSSSRARRADRSELHARQCALLPDSHVLVEKLGAYPKCYDTGHDASTDHSLQWNVDRDEDRGAQRGEDHDELKDYVDHGVEIDPLLVINAASDDVCAHKPDGPKC